MEKRAKKQAVTAGAKSDADFALFAYLVNLRKQYRELLKQDEEYKGMVLLYDYYLKFGQFFQPQPLPKGFRRRRANDCYGNSFKLASFQTGLTYCEGYVLFPLSEERATEVEHGWCVTDEEKVIDLTLPSPGLSYFGVAYTPEQMAAVKTLPLTEEIVIAQLKQE